MKIRIEIFIIVEKITRAIDTTCYCCIKIAIHATVAFQNASRFVWTMNQGVTCTVCSVCYYLAVLTVNTIDGGALAINSTTVDNTCVVGVNCSAILILCHAWNCQAYKYCG